MGTAEKHADNSSLLHRPSRAVLSRCRMLESADRKTLLSALLICPAFSKKKKRQRRCLLPCGILPHVDTLFPLLRTPICKWLWFPTILGSFLEEKNNKKFPISPLRWNSKHSIVHRTFTVLRAQMSRLCNDSRLKTEKGNLLRPDSWAQHSQ